MYCEVCKKNPATIHYTKVVNGLKEEKHLCEECAAKLKQNGEFADFWQLDFCRTFRWLILSVDFSIISGKIKAMSSRLIKAVPARCAA